MAATMHESKGRLGALVSDAIGAAAKKLRSFLNDDYGQYAATLHGLDVVEEQLRSLPLDHLDRYVVVDPSVILAGTEWMIRLDEAANALEDLVDDMEDVATASPACWWRRPAPGHAVVAAWLGSRNENMVRMEVAVGRLASVYLQGGEVFGVPTGAAEAATARLDASQGTDDDLSSESDDATGVESAATYEYAAVARSIGST